MDYCCHTYCSSVSSSVVWCDYSTTQKEARCSWQACHGPGFTRASPIHHCRAEVESDGSSCSTRSATDRGGWHGRLWRTIQNNLVNSRTTNKIGATVEPCLRHFTPMALRTYESSQCTLL